MKAFEDDLFDMIRKIEFKPAKPNFQSKRKEDIKKIKNSSEIIISADERQNKCTVPVDEYKKILIENVQGVPKNMRIQ